MRLSIRYLAVLAIVLMIPALAVAQTESGKISGSVTDQSGAVLPGVTVNLKSVERATTRSTVTNAQGEYVFASLVPGNYEVTAQLSGFPTQQTRTNVPVGATVAVNLQMAVGAQTEVITVVGETAAAINTSTQDIATTVTETQIRDLPSITRNPDDLVGSPARRRVTPSRTAGPGTRSTARGRPAPTSCSTVGEQRRLTATVGQQVPLDSVQEFSVLTSNFSAQYGRASGGVVNVATKSGTNQIHGTVYEFFRNDALAANTFDNNANEIKPGEFDRHQAGFSLGGPVVKDKVHFFMSREYIRVRSTDTEISWVPTPELIAASGGARSSSSALTVARNINGPILTRGDVSAIVGTTAGPSTTCRPASPPSAGSRRPSRSTPAAATRRTSTSS